MILFIFKGTSGEIKKRKQEQELSSPASIHKSLKSFLLGDNFRGWKKESDKHLYKPAQMLPLCACSINLHVLLISSFSSVPENITQKSASGFCFSNGRWKIFRSMGDQTFSTESSLFPSQNSRFPL